MKLKRAKSPLHSERGFTLVELMLVIAILGVLASIAVQQVTNNRKNAYDRQAQATMRNLLTYAAIDTPQGGDTSGLGGDLAGVGYPDVELPPDIYWSVDNDGQDRWRFYFAHPGGLMGYYFWVPGNTYSGALNTDGSGNRSDKIFYDKLAGSYRNTASNGALP